MTNTNAELFVSDCNNRNVNNNVTSDKLISNIMNGITNIYDVLKLIDELYVEIREVYLCKVNDKKDFDVLIEYKFGLSHSIIIGDVSIDLQCVYDDDILNIMRAYLVLAHGNRYKSGDYYNNKNNDDKRMHTIELYLNYIKKIHINISNDNIYYAYIYDNGAKTANTNMYNHSSNFNSTNITLGINTKVDDNVCDDTGPTINNILPLDKINAEDNCVKTNQLNEVEVINANSISSTESSNIISDAITVAEDRINLNNYSNITSNVFKNIKKREKQKLKRKLDLKMVVKEIGEFGIIQQDKLQNCRVIESAKVRRLTSQRIASNQRRLISNREVNSDKIHAPRSQREPDDKEAQDYEIVDIFGDKDSYMIITRLISDINGTKLFEREHISGGNTKYSRYRSGEIKKKIYEGCYRCGVHGHIRKHCRFKKSK